jgi:hypothetical protein
MRNRNEVLGMGVFIVAGLLRRGDQFLYDVRQTHILGFLDEDRGIRCIRHFVCVPRKIRKGPHHMNADLVGLADRLERAVLMPRYDADQTLLAVSGELRALAGAEVGGSRADFIKGYIYAADRLAQPSLSIDSIQARAKLAAKREGYDET